MDVSNALSDVNEILKEDFQIDPCLTNIVIVIVMFVIVNVQFYITEIVLKAQKLKDDMFNSSRNRQTYLRSWI